MKSSLSFTCLLAVMIVGICAISAHTQSNGEWSLIKSSSEDIIFELPSEYLVNHSKGIEETSEIYAYPQDGWIFISKRKNFWGKNAALRNPVVQGKNQVAEFLLGEFAGRMTTVEDAGSKTVQVYACSSKRCYSISVKSRKESAGSITRFLQSIQFDKKFLYVRQNGSEVNTQLASVIEKLRVSAKVSGVISKSLGKNANVSIGDVILAQSEPEFSRPLWILERPKAKNLMNVVAGKRPDTVRALVTFRRDGEISYIVVDKTAPLAYAQSAAEAAMGIKFLPAEVNGVPVDVTRVVTYSFTGPYITTYK
jgi:hypothetical protein